MKFCAVFILAVFGAACISMANGHAYLADPPGRSSAWRFGYSTPHNYNDNQINCGRAKLEDCGVCGDPLSQTPGANVNGGKYGTGTIVRTYKEGDLIHTKTEVTANDMGWFEFAICSLDDKPHANESCFVPLKVVDEARHPNGFPKPEYKWKLFKADGAGVFDIKLELPLNFTCDHCTLRSLWNCGNDYGCEANGKCGIGFGPDQAKFYACADISITSHGNPPTRPPTPPGVTGNKGPQFVDNLKPIMDHLKSIMNANLSPESAIQQLQNKLQIRGRIGQFMMTWMKTTIETLMELNSMNGKAAAEPEVDE